MSLFFLTFQEIIDEFSPVSDHDLFYLVLDEKRLTALDEKKEPIEWDQLKKEYLELCEIAQQPGIHEVKKKSNHNRHTQATYGMPDYIFEQKQRNRLISVYDYWLDKQGNQHKTKRVPEKILFKRLQNENLQTNVPERQYNEIMEGWNRARKEYIAANAFFSREEVEDVLSRADTKPPYLDDGHDYYIPELAALVETWLALYHDRTLPPEPEAIIKHIKEKFPRVVPLAQNLENTESGKSRDAYMIKILSGGSPGQRGTGNNLFKKLCKENKD